MDINRRMRVTLRFYNRLTDSSLENISQVPKDKLAFLMRMPYEALAAPFIVEDNERGKGRYHLSNKYALSERQVRGIIQ